MNENSLWRFLQRTSESIKDIIPPYHTVEGPLLEKEPGSDGVGYIWVKGERVEVDLDTFQTLQKGEGLRVSYTRRKKVISIERFPLNHS